MFSVESWVMIGFSVLLCLLYEWARSRFVDLFTHVFNFAKHQRIGTMYNILDRTSASEESCALKDPIKTANDASLDSNDFENEAENLADRSSCGLPHLDDDPSMDVPPVILYRRGGQFLIDLLSSKARFQPCSFSKSTHGASDANVELAASIIRVKPDQSSDAFEAAVNAALEKKFGDLEARLEACFQARLDAGLNDLGGMYVSRAVFEEKTNELKARVGKAVKTFISESECLRELEKELAKKLPLIAQNFELLNNRQNEHSEALVTISTSIQDAYAAVRAVFTKLSKVQNNPQVDLRTLLAVLKALADTHAVPS
jgi:hypothetical protein